MHFRLKRMLKYSRLFSSNFNVLQGKENGRDPENLALLKMPPEQLSWEIWPPLRKLSSPSYNMYTNFNVQVFNENASIVTIFDNSS